MLWRAVIATRSEAERQRLSEILHERGMLVEVAADAVELWRILNREPADFVFIGEALLSRPLEPSIEGIRALPEAPSVIVLRATADPERSARMLALGCDAVIDPQMSDAAVHDVARAVMARRRRVISRRRSDGEPVQLSRLGSFQSRSPAMQKVLEIARRLIPTQSSVLILGATGVGKEHLARAIHQQGPRGAQPFVPVNCAAIPESLFESELFGHEQGAFTGANRAHRGHFEVAHGGTIFLDEIGETPLYIQAKLLRALQDRVIQRVGAESTIPVDVRILAATNRDLERAIRDGQFRADLFYRLGVVTLTLPSLSERREDIPELVASFLTQFRGQIPTQVREVDEACMRALIRYDWPGNIRELINVLERALLISDGPALQLRDLPDSIRASHPPAAPQRNQSRADPGGFDPAWIELPWRDLRAQLVDRFEREYLIRVLEATEGRVGAAAKRSGMSARALFEKMRRHGLRKEDFRE